MMWPALPPVAKRNIPEACVADLHLWPIFICYRRVDGGAAAHRLKETLDKNQIQDDKQPIQLDVYLDEEVPGVADLESDSRPLP